MAKSSIPVFAEKFPDSTARPSSVFHFPGVSDASTKVVRRILEENDRKHDIYERARFAHNHFPHSALTRYALGGSAKLLEDNWKHDEPHLVNLDPTTGDHKVGDLKRLPEKITKENWDCPSVLGFKDAYSKYIVFFHEEITRLGPLETLNEYVFSPQANWESKNGKPPPRMIEHLMAGVLHPFIHAGFGMEFKDRVILAEGLAEACVHPIEIYQNLYPDDWPKSLVESSRNSTANDSSTASSKVAWTLGDENVSNSNKGKSLLEVYVELCADKDFDPGKYNPDELINDRLEHALDHHRGAKLRKIVSQWSLTDEEIDDGPNGWRRKLAEVDLLAALMACATSRRGYERRVDFFLMHALTSSIFMHGYLPYLSIPNRRVLVVSYLLTLMATSLSRGRPKLDVQWLMEATPFPMAPGTTAKKGNGMISDPTDSSATNPWLDVIESSLYYDDSHVPKAIRSLVFQSSLYGSTPPGGFIGVHDSAGKEILSGVDRLDGSVFVRAAGVIMEVMGWRREGQKGGNWDRSALGYDEAWKNAKRV